MAHIWKEAPVIPHGDRGEGKSRCCGTWTIFAADLQGGDIGPVIYELCNECGEHRDLSDVLGQAPIQPKLTGD